MYAPLLRQPCWRRWKERWNEEILNRICWSLQEFSLHRIYRLQMENPLQIPTWSSKRQKSFRTIFSSFVSVFFFFLILLEIVSRWYQIYPMKAANYIMVHKKTFTPISLYIYVAYILSVFICLIVETCNTWLRYVVWYFYQKIVYIYKKQMYVNGCWCHKRVYLIFK